MSHIPGSPPPPEADLGRVVLQLQLRAVLGPQRDGQPRQRRHLPRVQARQDTAQGLPRPRVHVEVLTGINMVINDIHWYNWPMAFKHKQQINDANSISTGYIPSKRKHL